MVELTMMGRLLEALRPECRLVLVGDPRQLTSVGAGAVLSDLVAGYEGRPDSPVSALTENFRSEEDIKALAVALREGDADEVLRVLRTPSDQVSFVEAVDEAAIEEALRPDSVAAARAVWQAASNEDPRRCPGRARPLPPALRPPRGALRRTPVEPAGRAVARRGSRDRQPRIGQAGSGTSADRCW